MPELAAIKAAFSDWRTVKGRKCLQLIFEVPLEQQGQVLDYLGAPMPDDPKWCGIAKLNPESRPVEQSDGGTNTPPAGRVLSPKERYALMSPQEQAVARAGILCADPEFWAFMGAVDQNHCVANLHERLRIDSRVRIKLDETVYRDFQRLETEWLMASGKMASPS